MAWPSLSDYNAALLKAPATLLPASLAGYRVVPGPIGLPMPVSGGYAYIYELRNGGGSRKALRCFREDDRERRARTATVCRGLDQVRTSWPDLAAHFIWAAWEDACLETPAGPVPAMVMNWVEGVTLGARLEALQDDPGGLRDLRERIARMLILLASERIVHGDLQTGNILTGPDGTPVLIDYDGLILPGVPSASISPDLHPNFQHPEWNDSCDPELKDRFPSIVLDLGLAAASEDPGLFPRFSTGENVLFRAEDFAEPDSSPVFEALRSIPSLSRAAVLLAGLALGPVTGLPSLAEFRGEAWKARPGTAARTRAAAPEAPAGPAAYRGVYPVYATTDYTRLLEAVGGKVEVIGRVVGVKRSQTKYGKPYAFVNFGDWRRDGFKLTVWSEGLETFRKPPADSWEGRWVTATGLVDEPYESERFGNTQLSITIQDASQVRFLDEAEALRRLGKSGTGAGLGSSGGASGKASSAWTTPGTRVRASAGSTGPAATLTAARTATGTKPSNAELLGELRSGTSATTRPAGSPVPTPSSPTYTGGSGGCLVYILIGIGIAIFMSFWNLI
ncbi:MAG TPA: hypothetical protein VLH39_01365 [Magnetospirillaceae bacterium]|nr:hypothetical protein [Magnetospirillaceae bacterium]